MYSFDEKISTPLCEIMGRNGSDKGALNITSSWHNYTTLYYSLFKGFKDFKCIRIFELGLGTLNVNLASNMGHMGSNGRSGASLYGWSEFFPDSHVFGADIDRDTLFNTEKIHTFFCDQTKPDTIQKIWEEPLMQEGFDIIIDDGLHEFNANVCFFENSIHKLNTNGYFIIEDILKRERHLFIDKIKEWEARYTNCTFTLLDIPSTCNYIDNNVLVVKRV